MKGKLIKVVILVLLLAGVLVVSLTTNSMRFYEKLSGADLTSEFSSNTEPRKLLISTDNSVTSRIFFDKIPVEQDDALALAILLKAHIEGKVRILGVTSTFGNIDGERTYDVTKKQLELSGVDIALVKGALSAGQLDSEAVEFITETLRESEGKVTLVALGPVTDYAAVFKKHPELIEKVDLFFFIRSGPYYFPKYWYLCSFNALKDIRSAKYLFNLPIPKVAIGKEVVRVGLTNSDVIQIKKNSHPMVQFMTRDLISWNKVNKFLPNPGYFTRNGNMIPWDLVWSMYLVEPQLFETYKHDWGAFIRIKDVNQLKTSAKVYLEEY